MQRHPTARHTLTAALILAGYKTPRDFRVAALPTGGYLVLASRRRLPALAYHLRQFAVRRNPDALEVSL